MSSKYEEAVSSPPGWVRLNYAAAESYSGLREALHGRPAGYYLARPPSKLRPILAALADRGFTPRGDGSRIVVDKALGEDAASARELDSQLGALSEES